MISSGTCGDDLFVIKFSTCYFSVLVVPLRMIPPLGPRIADQFRVGFVGRKVLEIHLGLSWQFGIFESWHEIFTVGAITHGGRCTT